MNPNIPLPPIPDSVVAGIVFKSEADRQKFLAWLRSYVQQLATAIRAAS